MRVVKLKNVIALVIALTPMQALQAQDGCDNDCKINSNLAMVVNVPVNSTAQVFGSGWGGVGGAGYNFNQRNAVVGEFLWNREWTSSGALQPLEAVAQSGGLSGHADLFVLTGDYRYEMRSRLLGTYFMGGGGWYFRNTSLSSHVTSGAGAACSPAWLMWGFTCTSGTVTPGQTRAGFNSNAFGANAGVGFTVRVGEAPYRFYTEARYHYAPTKNINTQFIAVTIGIRY
jgi:Outer membrane protein beta-barrel domain